MRFCGYRLFVITCSWSHRRDRDELVVPPSSLKFLYKWIVSSVSAVLAAGVTMKQPGEGGRFMICSDACAFSYAVLTIHHLVVTKDNVRKQPKMSPCACTYTEHGTRCHTCVFNRAHPQRSMWVSMLVYPGDPDVSPAHMDFPCRSTWTQTAGSLPMNQFGPISWVYVMSVGGARQIDIDG